MVDHTYLINRILSVIGGLILSLHLSLSLGFAEKTLIPLETTFGAHFKKDKVTEVKPDTKQVVLSSGETLSYDILIIATGSIHKWPIKLVGPEREDCCKQYDALVEQVGERFLCMER